MKLGSLDRKKFRIRNKLKKIASKDRFRLCVSRSTKNISVQIIDDAKNITLASVTSNSKEMKMRFAQILLPSHFLVFSVHFLSFSFRFSFPLIRPAPFRAVPEKN